MSATTTEVKSTPTELFAVDLSDLNMGPIVTFDAEHAADFGNARRLPIQGLVDQELFRGSPALPPLAFAAIELAELSQKEFGVELQFHLNLSVDYRPTMVIDSGAEELLAAARKRVGKEPIGYARFITDAELPWGYISDIKISLNRILAENN